MLARVARAVPAHIAAAAAAAPIRVPTGPRVAVKRSATQNVFKRFNGSSTNTTSESTFLRKPLSGPVSPALGLYRFPLPAITSITHRITGVALGVAVAVGGVLSVFSPEAVPTIIDAIKIHTPILVPVFKLLLAFPFAYHCTAAARHIYWDVTGKGLESIEEIDKSSKIVVGVSAALTLLLVML